MIEVEKKFQPTPEQLEKLIEDAEFLGEKILHDIYYDYPDYRMFKKDVRFRNRNGNFELKIGKKGGVAEEIENIEDIKKYFNTGLDLNEFINQNLVSFIDYSTNRKKYKKGEFVIDIDNLSYGCSLVEIELLVDSFDGVENATNEIIKFGKNFGLDPVNSLSKKNMYLKTVKPKLYEELFG